MKPPLRDMAERGCKFDSSYVLIGLWDINPFGCLELTSGLWRTARAIGEQEIALSTSFARDPDRPFRPELG